MAVNVVTTMKKMSVANKFIDDINNEIKMLPSVKHMIDINQEDQTRGAIVKYSDLIKRINDFMYTIRDVANRFNGVVEETSIHTQVVKEKSNKMYDRITEQAEYLHNVSAYVNETTQEKQRVLDDVLNNVSGKINSAEIFLQDIVLNLRAVNNDLKQLYSAQVKSDDIKRYNGYNQIVRESKALQLETANFLGIAINEDDIKFLELELGNELKKQKQ